MHLEIIHAPKPPQGESHQTGIAPPSSGAGRTRDRRQSAREVLDRFVCGTAAAPHTDEACAFVWRDVARALAELSRQSRAKAMVRLYDEPWELCVERFGSTASLSVYRAAPEPIVAVYDRAIAFADVVTAACGAIGRSLGDGRVSAATQLELASALAQLEAIAPAFAGVPRLDIPPAVPVAIEPDRDSPISFGADFALREGAPPTPVRSPDPDAPPAAAPFEAVERSDLHALLFRGRMRADVRGHTIDLGECHPVLVTEHLVEVGHRAFDAWERGLPLYARREAAGVVVGVRVSAEGVLALTLGPGQGARREVHTFPALGVVDFLEAVLAFGRSLIRAILRRDRSQSANLRLTSLRRVLRESTETLRQASQADTKVNLTPDPYRAFATAVREPHRVAPPSAAAGRLRFASRWRSIVPGIDLRATYLCGDRIIAGAASEMWALDRQNGRVLWRADIARGTSIVTPCGIARLAPDGSLALHGFSTGEITLRTRIAPRVGGPIAGAVVHLPGLPRLVIVTEGEHHLVAVDMTTGETRWRWSWGATHGPTRAAARIKRAGRLLYFTCGDGALTALDVATGAVVWRVRDRLRFRMPPSIGHDALFAVSGGAHGIARLYSIDPYSGVVRWTTTLGGPHGPCTVEGAVLVAAGAVGVAIRTTRGKKRGSPVSALALAMFRLEDGAPLGARRDDTQADTQAPVGTSWLAVDDTFIGNMPTGDVMGIDARSGELRWRRVLGPRPLEADLPRRLEPVLRSGALFVPCSRLSAARPAGPPAAAAFDAAAGVCILCPSDGAVLGAIAPTEAIPDLLRVDEHCNVYVAEESGHIAAFAALPRLTLVSSA